MKSMMFQKPGEFFTQDEIKKLLQINHNKKEVGDIIVYDFRTEDYKQNPYSNPLYHINFFETNGDFNPYDNRSVKYTLHSDYIKGAGVFINSQSPDHIVDLISELSKIDHTSALEMMNRYQALFNTSLEAKSTSNKIITETNLMMDYLRKNNIQVEDLNIDVTYLNQFANDRNKLESELNKINAKFPKPISIESYNDCDYYPFLFENTYVIEDVSASKMLICKKDMDKTYWYKVERGTNMEMDDWISETMYTHHQLPKFALEALNEFSLIAEFHGNELVKSTIGIYYLNLLQGYIVEELVREDKIKPNLPDLSFEELVKHYAFQKEIYHIEERSIVELLTDMKVIEGKITYDGFGLVDPDLMNKVVRYESISEHHFRDIDSIPKLDYLEQHHKDSINKYLAELLDRDNTENTSNFIGKIQGKINSFETTVKPKFR
jgi:hypothetical protein